MSTSETLELLKQALAKGNGQPLRKAFTQSNNPTSGLTAYDLEAPAKTLYPVITPLRNILPRESGRGGIQANWRAITGINTNNVAAGVSEGNRGAVIATSTEDYLAAYKGLGLEDYVTFEADYAARGFDDVKARAVQGLLRALMIQEEKVILYGNTSLKLGTTPTPTLADKDSGGKLKADTTYYVRCVALTAEGYYNSSKAGVTGQVKRTNADGSEDIYGGGAAKPSAAASLKTASDGNDTHALAAVTDPVRGAVAYAWYIGESSGDEVLADITTLNSVVLTDVPADGQKIGSGSGDLVNADNSTNSLVFDGFLTFAANENSGSYWKPMPTGAAGTGSPLTSDNTGGIEEFDEALEWFWNEYKISPSIIWVSSREMNYIRKKVLASASNSAQRFVFTANQMGLLGGTAIKGYTNPFTMGEAEEIPIRIHPNMPPGTVLFFTEKLPYPLSGVTDINVMRLRQDYYQLEFPLRTRRYEYGVYMDGVLQCYAPFSLGMITNIAAG